MYLFQSFKIFLHNSSAGDFNGDGYDDMVLGDYTYDRKYGIAYVIYGQPMYNETNNATYSVEIVLSDIVAGNSSLGFAILGAPYSYFGNSVSNAGKLSNLRLFSIQITQFFFALQVM